MDLINRLLEKETEGNPEEEQETTIILLSFDIIDIRKPYN